MGRRGPPEEAQVALFTAKWANQDQDEKASLQDPFSSGLMNLDAAAVRASNHRNSPEAPLALESPIQFPLFVTSMLSCFALSDR
jgi:hypothetical protein